MTNAILQLPPKSETTPHNDLAKNYSTGSDPRTATRMLQFEFLRATEMAALNCLPWIGKGDKESADAAACDAIRGIFDIMEMRGEIVIGEGIKDEAPGLFAGERVGRWQEGTPRIDIAIDPLDGTTNLSKGLPNSISCIAAAVRAEDDVPALQFVPAFYMKKLAYPSAVRQAWIEDSTLPLDINAPLKDVIELTAGILGKPVREIVVMVLDRPRNAAIIDEVRSLGAQLRMIVDGDIAAALAPAIAKSGVDLYVGIGGAPEGILAAAGLRCMGGGMQTQMWPRDEEERASLAECGWSDRVGRVYRSRDLIHSNDVLFIATGISDSPLLRGVRTQGSTIVTHSVLMRQRSGSIRFVTTEHNVARRPVRLRSTSAPIRELVHQRANSSDAPHDGSNLPYHLSRTIPAAATEVPCLLLFGAPGSGKGTIGKALGALPGFTHCSSGDIIRAAANRTDGEPDRWKDVAAGHLLSDYQLWELFDEYFESYMRQTSQADVENVLLLDGIPRSRSQVDELCKRVKIRGVLHFDCGDQETLVRRIARRHRQGGRTDDGSDEAIRTRLLIYNKQTLPLLACFPEEFIQRVNAVQRPDIVLRAVLKVLEKFQLLTCLP